MQDNGKRKIVDCPEGEKSCKMKLDPIIMKEDLEEEAKRKNRI